MSKISENIRRFRIESGLKQAELGEALGKAPSVIANWEAGTNRPDVVSIEKMCAIFNVDANALLGWPSDDPTPPEKEKSPDELTSGERLYNYLCEKYGRPPTTEELERVDKLVDMFIDKPQ